MLLSGSDILMECLKEQQVKVLFGYPGGAVLNIYDALYKYREHITHILTSHEQGAAHAADGYARATGKVGVCLATSGPGATNLVTGIATAYMDSVPMVAITGNVSSNLLGKDSFQEVDIAGITMPITKHNFIVKDVSKLAKTIRRAFYIAQEGRPGPVLIDIPKDVTAAMYEYEYVAPIPVTKITDTIKEEALREAAELIANAKKPLIYGGGGIISSGASEALKAFVELTDSPICLSTMGLGGFPSAHPYFTGMVGMHGTKTSNLAVTQCDLLIAIGARFSDRVVSNVGKFAPNAKVLHIDVDPAEINKNVLAVHDVIGDLNEILRRLNQILPQLSHKDWMDNIQEMKTKYPITYTLNGKLRPYHIMNEINEQTKGEAVVVTDVGQHQMWACQFIHFDRPRSLLTSGGLGTMGYGLGAAIGAQIGCPDRKVINITGDGCFRMNNIELGTAVAYNVPIIEIILNNHALGMVRQWQTFFYDARYSHTTLDKTTDFVALAQAYKAKAYMVTTPDEFKKALAEALAGNEPVVINCEIGDDEKVYPMVPPGKGIDELVMEEN